MADTDDVFDRWLALPPDDDRTVEEFAEEEARASIVPDYSGFKMWISDTQILDSSPNFPF